MKEHRKEYRIFHKDNFSTNGKWVYFKIAKSYKTLEEAKKELARLREAEERRHRNGKDVTKCGDFGIEANYPSEYHTEYKIGVREVTPFEFIDC